MDKINDVTVNVYELRKKVNKLIADGIKYVDITFIEGEIFEGRVFPKSLNFDAYDGNGDGINYEGIDHKEVSDFYKSEGEYVKNTPFEIKRWEVKIN
ncbi:hypothetical protein [Clostridium sp.]